MSCITEVSQSSTENRYSRGQEHIGRSTRTGLGPMGVRSGRGVRREFWRQLCTCCVMIISREDIVARYVAATFLREAQRPTLRFAFRDDKIPSKGVTASHDASPTTPNVLGLIPVPAAIMMTLRWAGGGLRLSTRKGPWSWTVAFAESCHPAYIATRFAGVEKYARLPRGLRSSPRVLGALQARHRERNCF